MGKILSLVATGEFPGQNVTGINLAIALHGQSTSPVVYADLGTSPIDELPALFDNKPVRNVFDLLPVAATGTPDLLKGYLREFAPGVIVIEGTGHAGNPSLSPSDIKGVLKLLSSAYPYTIVAIPAEENDRVLPVIDSSDLVILLTAPELLSLKRAKHFLDRMASWHFSSDLIRPVLTRIKGVSSYLAGEEVQRVLAIPVLHTITCEPDVIVSSVNKGEFPAIAAPMSGFSRDMYCLASYLTDDASFPAVIRVSETGGNAPAAIHRATEAPIAQIKDRIHKTVINELGIKRTDINRTANTGQMRMTTRRIIEELLSKEAALSRAERAQVIEEMLDEILGLGCIEKFLNDPAVTEIMVNGPDRIYIEKGGKIHLTDARFSSSTQLLTVIERIVSPIGRRIDESLPLVDARLGDGSRVNVIIPPVSLAGPALTIRKFSKNKLTADDLVTAGAIAAPMVDFIKACVQLRKNIVISGGTGSGKTTLLNVVSSFIPADERIVTIEDSAELRLPQEHVVRLESRRPSVEGTGEVSIRHLVTNALRMRPDRIIVGECRAGETLDMLQAMNTGHDGSLTTIHANSPRDAIGRIATLALMAGTELPERAVREQICSAIHIIVQLSRLPDGSRKVVEIAELSGLRDGQPELLPLFVFERKGVSDGKVLGAFAATGKIPTFLSTAGSYGISIDKHTFTNNHH